MSERDPFNVRMEGLETLLYQVLLIDERNADPAAALPADLIWRIEEVLGCTCHPKMARLHDCALHQRLSRDAGS